MKNIQPIKDDWKNQRCNPGVIPFAGFINKPDDKSAIDFTSENFVYCTLNIFKPLAYALTGSEADTGVSDKPINVCFDKNTMLKLATGEEKPISQICVGDVLEKSGEVTAVLKLDAGHHRHRSMFKLNNVIVSGSHKINYFGLWIPVSMCPKRELLREYDEPYLYCLNTTSKRIFIKDMEFSDWDEIFEEDVEVLKKFCKNLHLYKKEETDVYFIHNIFNNEFLLKKKIK